MYSLKRNDDVVALFVEESDAEKFREWKVSECEEELMEEKSLEYLEKFGEKELGNDVFMMIGGVAATEAAKMYVVVDDNEIERLREHVEDLERILQMFDNRKNRKRYLAYWRKREGRSDLCYPDGDQIYEDFWKVKEENDELRLKMSYMIDPNAIGDRHEMGSW